MPKPRAYTLPPASPLSQTVVSAASLRVEAEKTAKIAAAREKNMRSQAYATPAFDDEEDDAPLYISMSFLLNSRDKDEYSRTSISCAARDNATLSPIPLRIPVAPVSKGPQTVRDELLESNFLRDISHRYPMAGALTFTKIRLQHGYAQRQKAMDEYMAKRRPAASPAPGTKSVT